ncbi:MAG: flavodoxin [bacterium]|nr:flavodoxin [bacterium]
MKTLIAYFSRADENYVSGALKTLEKGNTEVVAEMIQKETGADLFKINPVVQYAVGYNDCIAEAKEDQRRNARPELTEYPDNISEYDTIYLGFPNYWGTMPMAVFTFLERYDFDGKVIKPFCTHEGSGMGRSESDIRRLCGTAMVEKGLAIHGSSVLKAADAVKKFVQE